MRQRINGFAIGHDWNARVRQMPTGRQVASLIASHGKDAVVERWGWLTPRMLATLAKEGCVEFAATGERRSRQRKAVPLDRAA